MNYTETTASYNERRYGRPWMAVVGMSTTKDFRFLDWDGRPGHTGEFCFDVEPGTILAYGQKDNRKGRGGVDGYQIAMPDGTLPAISDEMARAVNKLPMSERVAAAALRIIDAKAKKIAEYEALPTSAEPYYVGEVAKLRDGIARFQSYLPAAGALRVAVDMAGFGF